MKSTQPPRIARWLLEHFGCSPNNATVAGDLDERYHIGRSAAWYWKQVAAAIGVSFFKEIWNHKLRAVTAVISGWLFALMATHWFNTFLPFNHWPWLLPTRWIYPDGWMVLLTWMMFVATGWFVAKTHPAQRRAMVLICALSFFQGLARFAAYLLLEKLNGELPPGAYPVWLALLSGLFNCSGILFGGGIFTNRESTASFRKMIGGSMSRTVTIIAFIFLILVTGVLQLQAQFTIHAASDEAVAGWTRMEVSNRALWISPTVSLTSADILRAEPSTRPDGSAAVNVVFTDAGATKMRDLSIAQKDKLIAMVLDGKVIFAPKVRAEISKEALVTGNNPAGLSPGDVQRIVAGVGKR